MYARSKEKNLTFSSRCGCQQYNQVVLGLLKWVKIKLLFAYSLDLISKWGQSGNLLEQVRGSTCNRHGVIHFMFHF